MTNYLQTRPHRTKLYLSVYQPETVLAAQINDPTIGKGETEITYNLPSEGSYVMVESGMVMYIGTSAGASDMGRVRVKSATDTVVTVAENDHIDWTDNHYITIARFWNIDAIYPRIIQDPANELDVIFYKDWDIEYSDQNRYVGGFINMGSHYAGFLDPATGQHDVYYDASGTVPLTGDFTDFDWFIQGATVTGSSSMVPGYHTYDTPGHYMTRLAVTGTSGYQISYRQVSIYDKPGEGSTVPVLKWELENLQGSRTKGGYSARIRIREPVDQEFVKEGSLVVIFSEDWYGGTKHSLGGSQENRESIVFVGYVVENSITYNYHSSFVEFEVESPTGIMKRAEGFSISVESKTSPNKWYELYEMNLEKATHHFLKWHSTVLLCTDVKFPATNFDEEIQYFDADRTSLYSAVDTLMRGASFGKVVSDRQGIIWMETEAYANPSDPTAIEPIEKVDWLGEPAIKERLSDTVSWIEIGGIAFELTGASGTSTPLISAAPGDTPGYRGKLQRQQGLALTDQAQLNALAGNVYAHYNSQYPEATFQLVGNYRNYDIAPIRKVPITIGSGDTIREITLTNEPFITETMAWIYDPVQELFRPVISLYQLKRGIAGDTITIPVDPPTEGDGGGFDQLPPFDLPPIPPFPAPGDINRLALYDEGVFQGLVAGLDFVGSDVVASVSGSVHGVATYSCSPMGTTAAIACFLEKSGGTEWSAGDLLGRELQEPSTGETGDYKSGMSSDSSKITMDHAGTYAIHFSGQVACLREDIRSFPNTTFTFTYYIMHYNSSNELQRTYSTVSSGMFLYEIDGGDNHYDAFAGLNAQVVAESGDYLKIEAEGFPSKALPAVSGHHILVYRV